MDADRVNGIRLQTRAQNLTECIDCGRRLLRGAVLLEAQFLRRIGGAGERIAPELDAVRPLEPLAVEQAAVTAVPRRSRECRRDARAGGKSEEEPARRRRAW